MDQDTAGNWPEHIGQLPALFDHLEVDPTTTHAAVCGPAVVYQHILPRLVSMGFSKDRILISLLRRM